MPKLATALALVLLTLPSLHAGPAARSAQPAPAPRDSDQVVHHYEIDGAVRPLLFFWISRSNVGRAIVTWRHDPHSAEYSLLIGSDPTRAPHHLNRWGYADEQLRGPDATIVGVMTRSDEQSLDEAKADVKNASGQPQAFRVIRETVDGQIARSAVMTLGTQQHYTFEQLDDVLAKVPPTSKFEHQRSITLPPGTAPGFLAAVNRLIGETLKSASANGDPDRPAPIRYVYCGKLYRLGMTDLSRKDELTEGGRTYRHLLETKFEIHNIDKGDDTDFDMTYGTEGALRGIPVTVQYQPRWWLRLKLRLADPSS